MSPLCDFDVEVLQVMSTDGPQLVEAVYRRGQYEGHGTRWTHDAVREALERLADAGEIARCDGSGWYQKLIRIPPMTKEELAEEVIKIFGKPGDPDAI